MTTYKDSGVNIDLGDLCSKIAYHEAKRTFVNRKGRIGEPVILEGGFSGALDMGDYYLVQNDDGVGSKAMVAHAMRKYDTLGYDLVAMVVDDGICLGAEMMTVSNTIDIEQIDQSLITDLMRGLGKAAKEAGVVVPGGEIAELSGQVNGFLWNATAIGIVKKDRLITGKDVQAGDAIVGLRSAGFRSNGFSLVRKILHDRFGPEWHLEKFDEQYSWGDAVLIPSRIYCHALGSVIGTFSSPPYATVHALAHITGGGLPGNVPRVTSQSRLGVTLDRLPSPHASMLKLQELGHVSDEEAYQTWNMGIGMAIVTPEPEKVLKLLSAQHVDGQVIGEVTKESGVRLVSQGFYNKEDTLVFE